MLANSAIELVRTNQSNADFLELVKLLNQEQAIRNGDKNDYYMQFNQLSAIDHVIVAYQNKKAIGCGGLRAYDTQSVEIKRMFTPIENRKQGVAAIVLAELEQWASELGYQNIILETGTMNPEAIQFYKKNKYKQIPSFEPYIDDEDSICFEKNLG